MSKHTWFLFIALLTIGLVFGGCPASDDDDDSSATDDDVSDDDVADDDVADDDVSDDDTSADVCEDAAALRDDAVNEGTQLEVGITLEESIAIGEILSNSATYADQVVQVEGFVTDICDNAGCWAELEDHAGDSIILKVDDFYLDWRNAVEVGLWVIGEGEFHPSGGHGPEVYVVGYGAMVGTINCAGPN